MVHERVKTYIRSALDRKYPVETIINNLVSAGHERETVRRLTREVIAERIHELEGEMSIDPMAQAEKAGRRGIL